MMRERKVSLVTVRYFMIDSKETIFLKENDDGTT